MKRLYAYVIKDKVFLIAFTVALISMFFVLPSRAYFGYINIKVLVIMFTLMVAVAGVYETHFFDYVATKLVIRFKSIKWIALVIILATFFLAMLLTNDAVLLTLIPFTLFITRHTHQEKHALTIMMLQTIAANMGSALTPMGDPQNIYLYAFYDIPFYTFLTVTFPITLIGFILVTVSTIILIPNTLCQLNLKAPQVNLVRLMFYFLILMNALLSVLRIIPVLYTLLITIFLILIFARHLFRRVDYTLLLTFVSFFIFTGNLAQMPFIKNLVEGLLNSHLSVFFSGLVLSQFISNVPAAVILSTFTSKNYWQALVQGVNIGAMGTIIASLASLITFKYVLSEYPKKIKSYLVNYSLISIVFIVIISFFVLVFF